MKKLRSKIRKHFYVVTYAVNIAMIPAFLLCLVTGIFMFPGLLELLHIRARKLPMETFAFLHDWSGLALGAGILFHLYLHWRAFWQFLRLKVFQLPPKSRAKHAASHGEVAHQGDS